MKKMKWFLLVLIVFMSPAVNAQLRFGVKGGLNIASVKFNKDVVDPSNVTGFHIGPMIELMTPVFGLGLDAAVLYSQKGFEADNKSFKNDFLEVPVNLKWKMDLPLVKPYFAAGPYVGFRVAGDKLKDISGNVNDIKGQVEAKSFSAGLNFTVGAEVLNMVQVGLTYGLGLTENYKTFVVNDPKEYSGKTHTWSISAAVLF